MTIIGTCGMMGTLKEIKAFQLNCKTKIQRLEMSSNTSKLSEIVEVRSGYQVRKVSDDSAGTHYYLQVSDFNEDRTLINSENMQMISPPRNAGDYELQEGDVVFLSKGQNNFSFAIRSLPKPAIAASYFFVLKRKFVIKIN